MVKEHHRGRERAVNRKTSLIFLSSRASNDLTENDVNGMNTEGAILARAMNNPVLAFRLDISPHFQPDGKIA